MLTRLTDDVLVNPDKVEMVILETAAPDGTEHEKPFVVVGFQGGGGRALHPKITLDEVVEAFARSQRPTSQVIYNSAEPTSPSCMTYAVVTLSIIVLTLAALILTGAV